MFRAESNGDLPCLYRVSQDFEAQSLTGERLLSGVTSMHDRDYKNIPDMEQYMGAYKASRSLFPNRKVFKEYLRGGSDGPCRDFDITKSFTRARADRGRKYGLPITELEEWIQRPDHFAARCGLSLEQCKAFITAAPTSGDPFAQGWLNECGIDAIPAPLITYRVQVWIQQDMLIDFSLHPRICIFHPKSSDLHPLSLDFHPSFSHPTPMPTSDNG